MIMYSTGIDDLFDVQSEVYEVAPKWKALGLALRLQPGILHVIESNRLDPNDCLTDVLTKWLQQHYNTERFGLPSWKMLVDAVAHPAGGNNSDLAQHIATKYNGKNYTIHPL